MPVHDWIILDHLDRMTDSTGLIQHAIYSVPRRESGYTTDDNARALRLCVRLRSHGPDNRMLDRITNYLSFLEHARHPVRGFHNFLSYQRDWLDAGGTGDCQGQAIRALAEVLGSDLADGHRALARELIDSVLPVLADLRSLRAQAYVILAWGHLWTAGVKNIEFLETVARSAAQRLVECYRRSERPDWQWYESRLTYANAVLPHALFIAARRWPAEDFADVAEKSFAFLDRSTTSENVFWPIGNSDWYSHGERKSLYDQQPVEAAMMADAALAAFCLLRDEKYLSIFCRAHDWFHGRNSLKQQMIDAESGGCFDGLQASGLNRNQGAESTLAHLWTEVHNVEMQLAMNDSLEAGVARI
ncbi:MAG TPA: hypothetical protein VFE46_04450 [Pirellulales bacterium]|jgi:hypothetical protein|nr:hypothetical protein [Pirellulales bacterium]